MSCANDPNHAQALAYLGDIEMKKDNPEGALDLTSQGAVQIRDDLRIAYLDMGVILAQQNRHPEAIAAFKRAESLDPSQPDAHLRLGRLYKATGDDVAAQKEFSKLRELHQKADDDIASKMSGSAARTPPSAAVELVKPLQNVLPGQLPFSTWCQIELVSRREKEKSPR